MQGFLTVLNKAAVRNAGQLQSPGESGLWLVGLDPAMTFVYRKEYQKVSGLLKALKVELPQEWLFDFASQMPKTIERRRFRSLAHCTEKTDVPISSKQLVDVFQRANLDWVTVAIGCCGMSGIYGHETRNQESSRVIFSQLWQKKLDENDGELLATGYSCRSQIKRLAGRDPKHPLEILSGLYRQLESTHQKR